MLLYLFHSCLGESVEILIDYVLECLKTGTKKVEKVVLNKNLTYYNGQIQTTYGENPAINITFECNQQALGLDTGPTCEKKSNTYDCHWQTPFVCRPMISLQCSIRDEEKDTDNQYDFSSLSKSDGNWRAKVTGPNLDGVSFFINVCRTVLLKGAAAHCPPTSGVCKVQGYVCSDIFILTLYTLTSVCIFSIMFFIHLPRCWQGEFV